ncbi:MAG: HAD hydrolase-like protein [Candidatus Thioglobus sp.]|nr:HAD hydrolase-like protein [Candidatus Thioglobus sp.]
MPLKALIFDVDGTLANTERDGHLVAFNLAFKELGLNWIWSSELYQKLLEVTGGQLRIKHYISKYQPDFKENLDDFAAEAHRLKTSIYVDLVSSEKIPLRPGVQRLLLDAKAAGLRLAIATTTTLANVNALIINTLGHQALGWFEVIGAGNVVENLKPAGDIYAWVLAKMSLPAEDCMAFEDSNNGLVSALAVNLPTLITVNEYTKTHKFAGSLAVLDNLGEPDAPFELISGAPTEAKYVDINYLKELYEKYY